MDAQTALQQARSARDKARKDADQERKAFLARLEDVEDERAQRVKDALSQKDWGLEDSEGGIVYLAGDYQRTRQGEPIKRPANRDSPRCAQRSRDWLRRPR